MAQQTPQNNNDRNPRKALIRLGVMLVAVTVMLSTAWVITSVIEKASPGLTPPSEGQQGGGQVSTGSSAVGGEGADLGNWNTIGPVQQNIEGIEITAPDYRMIALPENGRVDMGYFDTVTFVGDSITQGLEIYSSGIPNATYCAYLGISPKSIYDGSQVRRRDGEYVIPLDEIRDSKPDNVYVLIGANAIGKMTDEAFLAYYDEMLDYLDLALHPDVNIYIQSLTPVRPDNGIFDQDRLDSLNNQLAKLAYERGCHFIDLTEVLKDDDGYLREDFAGSDGYHMSPAGYNAWKEYLLTHTAYSARNPYLPGSPYYQE